MSGNAIRFTDLDTRWTGWHIDRGNGYTLCGRWIGKSSISTAKIDDLPREEVCYWCNRVWVLTHAE